MKSRLEGMLAVIIGFLLIGGCGGGSDYESDPLYRIEILDGSFPDSYQWDTFDGPDPYVCIKTVSTDQFCTAARSNTWSPSWLEESTALYEEDDFENLRIEVVDQDPDDDDVGFRDTVSLFIKSYRTPIERTFESKGGVTVRLRVTEEEF